MDLMAGWGVGDQDRMVQQILEEASAELALPQLGAKPATATWKWRKYGTKVPPFSMTCAQC